MQKEDLINYWKESRIITNKHLLDTFKKIKREDFILERYKKYAYEDKPLPILENQTISQPTTVMIMTQALEVKKNDKILEVGSGSGWQTAILSKLVGTKGKVYTIEFIEKLANFAKSNLKKFKNIKVIHADGSLGYEKAAPYDCILITAGCPAIPKPLIKQLKNNAHLIAPVGPSFEQEMIKITKKGEKLIKEKLGSFIFVPLKGKYGY